MSTMDWIITLAAIVAGMEMKDALRFRLFEDWQRRRRPRPHTFG